MQFGPAKAAGKEVLMQRFEGGFLDALLKRCPVSASWEELKPLKPPPNLLLFLLNL